MSLSHAILATLSNGCYSGYDLSKQFAGSVGFFWYATQQQIYRELSKLEEQGYLSAELVRQENRPDKRLLSITVAGKEYLREWISQPGTISPIKDDLLVKLFAGHLVDRRMIKIELQHHRTQHQATLNTYREIERQFFADPAKCDEAGELRYLTLLNGIQVENGWLAWCEKAIAILEKDSRTEALPTKAQIK
jgi:DNA-binding PadR family transcriptional regulator